MSFTHKIVGKIIGDRKSKNTELPKECETCRVDACSDCGHIGKRRKHHEEKYGKFHDEY